MVFIDFELNSIKVNLRSKGICNVGSEMEMRDGNDENFQSQKMIIKYRGDGRKINESDERKVSPRFLVSRENRWEIF